MLDDRDRALTHALHIDGRAPFSRIAAVLDISPQTVARRRHRRLRTEASLRVVGLPEPHRAGRTQWLVRLTAAASSAQDLAHAPALRQDTSRVKLTSGGTEIVAVMHAPTDSAAGNSRLHRRRPAGPVREWAPRTAGHGSAWKRPKRDLQPAARDR